MDGIHFECGRDKDDVLDDPESPGTTNQIYETLLVLDWPYDFPSASTSRQHYGLLGKVEI